MNDFCRRAEKPVDLQLPKPTHIPVKLSQTVDDEERTEVEFKERIVTGFDQGTNSATDSGASFGFKKRKFNRNNVRQSTNEL